MTRKVSLLFGVHAHQPAGNFESVLDTAHARCYKPYLDTVYRYPAFKFAVHFSGWLLDYLLRRHPQEMEKLREMVARGQAEMFGGGDTEPVLAAIPERDRLSQLAALSDRLERAFGQRPDGGWLTERVWESSVATSLAASGIEYVTVDDYHFLCAGKYAHELTGHFTTEEGGARLDLFPISEALRYRFPFSPADEAVRFLESLAADEGDRAAVYFDDIEKFGIWPETYDWVYERKWLEQFIEGVLGSALIVPTLYRDHHRTHATRGVVYLPATSYIEMNEWSLPPEQAHEWADLVSQEKAAGRYGARKPFIRGGIWRNFISRYPESNWMHKRMLALSDRMAALAGRKITPRMRSLLHLAQANDAYWHGLFGGLYLPHLRRAVWNAIVELEALLDRARRRPAIQRADADSDGTEEIFLSNGTLQAVLRDDGWAAVHELDAYALRHNFADTLARRTEHYYRKIVEGATGAHDGAGIASAHDRVSFRHHVTQDDLVPDSRPRTLFVDRAQQGEAFVWVNYSLATASDGRVVFANERLGLTKTIAIDGNALTVEYRVSGPPIEIETELNLAMPSCDGLLGRYVVDAAVPGGFGQNFNWSGLRTLVLEDDVLQGRIALVASQPVSIHAGPHHTVSQSESGFEKIMQAVTLRVLVSQPVSSLRIALTVASTPA